MPGKQVIVRQVAENMRITLSSLPLNIIGKIQRLNLRHTKGSQVPGTFFRTPFNTAR
jgi:hypothetical protein